MIYPMFSVNCYSTRHDTEPGKKKDRVDVEYKQSRVCIPGLMFYLKRQFWLPFLFYIYKEENEYFLSIAFLFHSSRVQETTP